MQKLDIKPGEILAIRTEKIERSLVPTWRIVLESKEGPRPLISLGSESMLYLLLKR